MNALPWADVDAAFAHDAFALIDMNELLWLDCFGEIVGIDLDELILVGPFRHWWVGVSLCHVKSVLTHQRTTVCGCFNLLWLHVPAILPPLKQINHETNENGMNNHDEDVANCFVTHVEWEWAAK